MMQDRGPMKGDLGKYCRVDRYGKKWEYGNTTLESVGGRKDKEREEEGEEPRGVGELQYEGCVSQFLFLYGKKREQVICFHLLLSPTRLFPFYFPHT